jgi:hypothetical protein
MNKLIILVFLIPISLWGQTTFHNLEIVEKRENNTKSHTLEIYSVLKINSAVLHGSYKCYLNENELYMEGYFNEGRKDSTWTVYQEHGKKIYSKGSYWNGERVGIWSFYNSNGALEQKYNFDKRKLISFLENDSLKDAEAISVVGQDTSRTFLDHKAQYIGGENELFDCLGKSIIYPNYAKYNGITGRVYVSFTIDSTGIAENFKVIRGIGGGCDEESIRVARLLSKNWIPEVKDGIPVSTNFILPFNYNIQEGR